MHTSTSTTKAKSRRPMMALGAAIITAGALMTVPVLVSPASASSGADIAFQDSNHKLQTVTPDRTLHPTGLGMATGTGPSIVQIQDGSYWTDFQANTGVLWDADPDLVGHPTQVRMAPGTSPAITFDPNESPHFREFVQDSAGQLLQLWQLSGLPQLEEGAMASGTSPSKEGDYQTPQNQIHASLAADIPQPSMAPGTSPSGIERLTQVSPTRKSHIAVAWQGGDNNLTFISDDSFFDTAVGMMPGTSPSIAIGNDGKYEVAFQANTGVLWTVTPDSHGNPHGQPTNLGMDQHSSPSITALPTGGFEIAFQADTHTLWTVTGAGFGSAGQGQPVTGASMAPGTSPSIDAFIPPLSGPDPTPTPTPTPSGGPTGFKSLTVENCLGSPSFGDTRIAGIWHRDVTTGSAFTEDTTLGSQWGPSGCPAPGTTSFVFQPPTNGHIYEVVAMDFHNTANGCTLDDPSIGSCRKSDTTFTADTVNGVTPQPVILSG